MREKATQKPFWRYHSSRNQTAHIFSDLYAMVGLASDIIPIQIVGPDMQLEKVSKIIEQLLVIGGENHQLEYFSCSSNISC